MPFVSQAQRKWMYANKPSMAKRWEAHTPKGKKLPEHVKEAAYMDGVTTALNDMGLKTANSNETHGSPYPSKSPTINAERLAQILQNQDDIPAKIYPENGRQSRGTVSWSHPINITGLDEGQSIAGVIVPANPRS